MNMFDLKTKFKINYFIKCKICSLKKLRMKCKITQNRVNLSLNSKVEVWMMKNSDKCFQMIITKNQEKVYCRTQDYKNYFNKPKN